MQILLSFVGKARESLRLQAEVRSKMCWQTVKKCSNGSEMKVLIENID